MKKLLLVGLDAADWNIINPLLDEGKLPALESLINNGIIGNLSTLDPPISPMLWTSIATGKKANKHGILGFHEPDEQSGIRPVSVTSRKTKAIWNILSENNYKCNVISWWPSHPAEIINGYSVSNFFNKTPDKGLIKNSVYPSSIETIISEFIVNPKELTQAHILPFVPDAKNINQEKDKRIAVIAKLIAEAASVQAVATYLLQNTEWNFTAVYFDMIDHFCHGFMRFYPPKMDGIPEELFNLYKNVVPAAYIFQDMMLQRLIDIAGNESNVMIVSDHGFRTGNLRPKFLPKFASAPILEHNPYGIFCLKGKNIKKDERIYGATLLDITPTILNLFGLPVAKDMDGKVLTDIYNNSQVKIKQIDSWETKDKIEKSNINIHPSFNEAMIKQLVDLGYISKPDKNPRKAGDKSLDEASYNLSKVELSSNNFGKALLILSNLHNKYPLEARFMLDLAQCHLKLGNQKQAKTIIDKLRTIKDKSLPNIDLLEAMLCIAQKKYKLAITLLNKAACSNPQLPNIHLQTAKAYLHLKQYKQAMNSFENALKIDNDLSVAHHGIGICYIKQYNFEKAIDYILTSIGLTYHFPIAHYHLAYALYKTGRMKDAQKALQVCLKLAPGFKKAENLIKKIKMNSEINFDIYIKKENIAKQDKPIIIVSGLPRSGTSMMMKMLEAGGLDIFTDNVRKSDMNNPGGYYEHEAVKNIYKDNSFLIDAEGKAVKIVAHLLEYLPDDFKYKIIFMKRKLEEVIASQQIMLGKDPSIYPTGLSEFYKQQIENLEVYAKNSPNIDMINVNYSEIVNNTFEKAEEIKNFLDINLDIQSMVKIKNPELYRNKK